METAVNAEILGAAWLRAGLDLLLQVLPAIAICAIVVRQFADTIESAIGELDAEQNGEHQL